MADNLNSKPKPWKEMSKGEKATIICCIIFLLVIIIGGFVGSIVYTVKSEKEYHGPEIKIVSMDFGATVSNDSRDDPLRSARWDLLIRVPGILVGNYMCLQGNLEASFLYKNVFLVTSSKQSYNILESHMPQLLNVSAVASEKDLSGAIGKEIMEAIKEKNEVRFGSRLFLSDCSEETNEGTMSYECDETMLRFEPSGSDDQIKASAVGKHTTCIISR